MFIEKGIQDVLAEHGIGGYYRYTQHAADEQPTIRGPYPKEKVANPLQDATSGVGLLNIEARFHLRKPAGATSPDPLEVEKMKRPC